MNLQLRKNTRDFGRAHGFSVQKRKFTLAFNKDGVQDVEKIHLYMNVKI